MIGWEKEGKQKKSNKISLLIFCFERKSRKFKALFLFLLLHKFAK